MKALLFFLVVCAAQTTKAQTENPLGLKAEHVAIRVKSLDETVKWYSEKLGFKERIRWKAPHLDSSYTLAYVYLNGFEIEIIGGEQNLTNQLNPPQTIKEEFQRFGYRHLSFEVANVDETYKLLQSKGVKFLREPKDNPSIKKRLALFEDNNGLILEICQHLTN
jgi:catechol 2,3-dioxygenase-like lactoylglutathione lyase family enzyme